ncbi:MAG: type II toxin-antitoxin system RelE/ParE family toxin [Phycisphaerae bacterium]|nr:type II toxin-antitoxin system RelE/ParE family toxin [Phycisphaerae bacterium]
MWEVEYTDEFERWWNSLGEAEQDSIDRVVLLLMKVGPVLGRPHVDTIEGSRHSHMKELRVQHAGEPYRVLFAFDPRRSAILLIGGKKTGDKRWYDKMVPLADRLYDEHLNELREEGLI